MLLCYDETKLLGLGQSILQNWGTAYQFLTYLNCYNYSYIRMWGQQPVYLKGSSADQYLECHNLLDQDSCLQISRNFYNEWQQQRNDVEFNFVDTTKQENENWIYIGLIGQIIHVGIQQNWVTNWFSTNRFLTLFLIFSILTLLATALVHTVGWQSILALILFLCYQLKSLEFMNSHPFSPCIENLNIFRKQIFTEDNPFNIQYLLINEILITPLQKLKIFSIEQSQMKSQRLSIYFRIQSLCKKLRQVEKSSKISQNDCLKFELQSIFKGNLFKKISCKILSICVFSFIMFSVKRYQGLSTNVQSKQDEQLKPLLTSPSDLNGGVFHKLLLFLVSQNNGNQLRIPTKDDIRLIQLIEILRLQFTAKLAVKKQQDKEKMQQLQSLEIKQQKYSDMGFIEKSKINNNYRVFQLNGQQGTIKQETSAKLSNNILELKQQLNQMIKKKQQKIENQECQKKQSDNHIQAIHKRQRRVEGFGIITLPDIQIDSSCYLQ